ncbi:DUF6603 domain-containing protein [Micromonospora sp. NPDC093277]|uniref:DUF6603 domain-containing protein n=1 Tax=Micromonospora sp. NPDC093277 TaxID=3364291 RepID=UPI0038127FAF
MTSTAADDGNLQRQLLAEVEDLLSPITSAASSPWRQAEVLDALGWDLAALAGMPAQEFEQWLTSCAQAVEGIRHLVEQGPPESLEDLTAALDTAAAAVEAVTGLPPALKNAGAAAPPVEVLASDLITFLTVNYLQRRHPVAYRAAILLTLITPADEAPVSVPMPATGAPVRLPRSRPELHLDRLGDLLHDPVGTLRAAYFPDGLVTRDAADTAAAKLFPRIAALLKELGIPARYGIDTNAQPDLGPVGAALAAHMLTLAAPIRLGDTQVTVGASAALSSADRGDLGLVLALRGALEIDRILAGWALTLAVSGSVGGFAIGPQGLTLPQGVDGMLRVALTADKVPDATGVALRIGSATGTRLEVQGLRFAVAASLGGGLDDVELSAAAARAALVVAASDGDGFLAQVLPADGLRAEFDLALAWSLRKGLTFKGAAGLDVDLPLHINAGPVEILGLHAALAATPDGLTAALGASATLRLGPLTATADRIGLTAGLTFPASGGNLGPAAGTVAFRPPSGVGLSLAAGPLVGGGYLFANDGQYAGVLHLQFESIAVTAVGLLATRNPDGTPILMPDGSEGFSLLVIISAEFTPIQLGFGFTLNGVGGLLGVHRRVNIDALRAGIRTGSLNSLLFPSDPVGRASELVATAGAAFPVAVGRYVFGPMARLGWGSPTLLTFDLGLVLELPAPLRLVVLGRLRMVLPDEKHPVVNINMDVLGVIDFGAEQASIDASLYDSQIAGFPITGDMAMRLSWGRESAFALSAGGFNPRFTPPTNFPTLRRMAIALSNNDNPRLRLEAYLALTSNTVQFGARLEVYATAAGFTITGMVGFDALVQLAPLGFIVDIAGAVSLRRGSRELMAVTLAVTLSGPRPWRARGRAKFKVLFVSASVSFDVSIGSRTPPPLPEAVNVGGLLDTALSDPANWTAQLPPRGEPLVTLRRIETTPGQLLAHPLGAIAVTQRVAPLGLTISRYGSAPVTETTDFAIAEVRFGDDDGHAAGTATYEQFARAQFQDMTDDEKLSAPSFELMEAGRSFSSDKIEYDEDAPAAVSLGYEYIVIDEPDVASRPAVTRTGLTATTAAPLTGVRLTQLSRASAAANAAARTTGTAAYRTALAPLVRYIEPVAGSSTRKEAHR